MENVNYAQVLSHLIATTLKAISVLKGFLKWDTSLVYSTLYPRCQDKNKLTFIPTESMADDKRCHLELVRKYEADTVVSKWFLHTVSFIGTVLTQQTSNDSRVRSSNM